MTLRQIELILPSAEVEHVGEVLDPRDLLMAEIVLVLALAGITWLSFG